MASASPPQTMTWMRAAPVLVVAAIFDVLRFIAEWFIVFGPVFAGTAAAAAASQYVGETLGTVVGFLTGGAVATLVGPELIFFGYIMAEAIGLIGWLFVLLIMVFTNLRIFKSNIGNLLWLGASLVCSEIPLLGSVPSLTATTIMLYRTQIKKERAARTKWEAQYAEALAA